MPDGTILDAEIPIEGEGEIEMPTELPEIVQSSLLTESIQAHQLIMNESKGNIASSGSLVRHIAAKKFDQVDTIEAGAVEKVLTAGK